MLIASLLFGISASLDALLVGISYGIRGVRVRLWQNLIISFITLIGTCLSVGLGHRLIPFLPELIRDYAGSLILTLLGFYYIAKWAMTHLPRQKPECQISSDAKTGKSPTYGEVEPQDNCQSSADMVPEGDRRELALAEVFTLSLTLSLNNLSAGLSASLAGLTLLPTAVSTLACSVLFLFSGNRLGQNPVLQFAGRAADPLSGILLIGLGLVQLLL